jgi:peptidyl-prolyl cis-trans isomerase A (cyclophilin A)
MTASRRQLLALAAALAARPAHVLAQAGPAPAPGTTAVALTTPLGRIVIALETARAPITSANFLAYVDRRLFDGASFYRASRPPGSTSDSYGLVQGGLRNAPEKLLPPIAHESTLKTGLTHGDGTLSMGRNAPGTAQADWFICLGEQAYLDADPKDPEANPGFAAFGRVTEGLEIVKRILVMPVDPDAGEGAMKGEMLQTPVPITAACRA